MRSIHAYSMTLEMHLPRSWPEAAVMVMKDTRRDGEATKRRSLLGFERNASRDVHACCVASVCGKHSLPHTRSRWRRDIGSKRYYGWQELKLVRASTAESCKYSEGTNISVAVGIGRQSRLSTRTVSKRMSAAARYLYTSSRSPLHGATIQRVWETSFPCYMCPTIFCPNLQLDC